MLLKTNTLKFSLRIFRKSTNLGNKHEMATLVMLLISRHKTANLYLFKSYSTITESICECFIFYKKQRKRSHIFHIYMY